MSEEFQERDNQTATRVPSVGGILVELVAALAKRSRTELERAAVQGRNSMDARQLKRDRDVMLTKLGREVLALVDGGEVDHPGLVRGATRVRELEERIAASPEASEDEGI